QRPTFLGEKRTEWPSRRAIPVPPSPGVYTHIHRIPYAKIRINKGNTTTGGHSPSVTYPEEHTEPREVGERQRQQSSTRGEKEKKAPASPLPPAVPSPKPRFSRCIAVNVCISPAPSVPHPSEIWNPTLLLLPPCASFPLVSWICLGEGRRWLGFHFLCLSSCSCA
uniref:Uncharacterized protein n=1 Tax=Aegilops tauschii subsp. strangulata TaxID=200361 RepID=A0A453RI57_AEGTS